MKRKEPSILNKFKANALLGQKISSLKKDQLQSNGPKKGNIGKRRRNVVLIKKNHRTLIKGLAKKF